MCPAFTGSKAIGAYRPESSFNNHDGTGEFKSFGRNVSVDTFEGANNGTQLFEFCSRSPTAVVESNFSGSFSVSFVLSTLEFIELYDTSTTDTDSDTNDEYNFDDPQSFEIVVHRKESTTGTNGVTRVATGCVAQSLSFDVSQDGLVNVTIDGVYAGEDKRDIDVEGSYSQLPSNKDALNFADVTLTYQGGSLALPRGVTINVDTGLSLLRTLGDRDATEFTEGPVTGSVDITHAVEVDETTTLESMYGSSSGTSDTVDDEKSIVITMDNGKSSGNGQVKAEWTVTTFTESYSESGIDVEADLVEADVSETFAGEPEIEVTEDFTAN